MKNLILIFICLGLLFQCHSAPSLWSKLKEWYKNKIQKKKTCPVQFDFVCACSASGDCVSADNPCILDVHNKQYGTDYRIIHRGLCKQVIDYLYNDNSIEAEHYVYLGRYKKPLFWGDVL